MFSWRGRPDRVDPDEISTGLKQRFLLLMTTARNPLVFSSVSSSRQQRLYVRSPS